MPNNDTLDRTYFDVVIDAMNNMSDEEFWETLKSAGFEFVEEVRENEN